MALRTDILPQDQLAFWRREATCLPPGWVLYGGTAIALQLGHRGSVDFDFFSSEPLDRVAIRASSPALGEARTLQDEPETLTVSVAGGAGPSKVSFFGAIDFGRVGEPLTDGESPPLASLMDLFGTKLATVTQRIEPRDYLDIAALLDAGLSINEGVSSLLALYGNQASAVQSVKTMSWFGEGDLEVALPATARETLMRAAEQFDPSTAPAALKSESLSPE